MTPPISRGSRFGESEKIAREDAVLVHGLVARGGEAPVRDEFVAAENAEDRVGVADIEREEHQEASADVARKDEFDAAAVVALHTRSTPLGSRPAVVPVKVSVAVVICTRLPLK